MSEKYKNLKVKELQELLQKNGIPHSGKKEDLIERLVQHDERKALESLEKEFELDDDFDEAKLLLSEIPPDSLLLPLALEKHLEKESVLSDVEDDDDFAIFEKKPTELKTIISPITATAAANPITASTTTTTATKAKIQSPSTTNKVNEVAATTKNSSFKFTPIIFDKKASATTSATTSTTALKATATTKTTTKTVKVTPPAPVTITPTANTAATITASLAIKDEKPVASVKKLRLEAERKLERSKRFGIKLGEKDMKEIRAARFGIAANNKEDTKKKVQVKVSNKPPVVPEKKLDPNQELLKKRAERFGIPEKKVVTPVATSASTATPDTKKRFSTRRKKPSKVDSPAAVVNNNHVGNNIKKLITNRKTNPIASNITKRLKLGRIEKPYTKNPVITLVMTKDNVLNKRQNKKLSDATINQSKRNIINHRKVNIVNSNNNGGRMISFTPNSTAPIKPPQPARHARNNNPIPDNQKVAIASHIGNGRTVTLAPVPIISNNSNSGNSGNNKRRRGRGGEPQQRDNNKRVRR